MLGGRIANYFRHRYESCKRCGVDYMAKPLIFHDCIGVVNTMHDAFEIDINDMIPIVNGVLLYAAFDHNSSIVKNQIQPTVVIPCLMHSALNRLWISNIDTKLHRLTSSPNRLIIDVC